MKCPSCNRDNPQGSKFCAYCGSPLQPQSDPASQPRTQQNTQSPAAQRPGNPAASQPAAVNQAYAQQSVPQQNNQAYAQQAAPQQNNQAYVQQPQYDPNYVPPYKQPGGGAFSEQKPGVSVTGEKSSAESALTVAMYVALIPCVLLALSYFRYIYLSFVFIGWDFYFDGILGIVFNVLNIATMVALGAAAFVSAKSLKREHSDSLFWGLLGVTAFKIVVTVLEFLILFVLFIFTHNSPIDYAVSTGLAIGSSLFAIGVAVLGYFLLISSRKTPFVFVMNKDVLLANFADAFDLYFKELKGIFDKSGSNAVSDVTSGTPEMGFVPLKTNRSLLIYILLSGITFGIYPLYFFYEMAKAANTVCDGDGEETPGLLSYLLLSLVTCGIYGIIWQYKLANRLQKNGPRYNLVITENGTTVLLWQLIGSLLCAIGPFVAFHIMIKNLNTLCGAYNNYQMANANGNNGAPNAQPGY